MVKENKVWKIAGTFKTYKDADNHRKSLIMMEKHTLVKVKRGAKEYRVKVWDPQPKKEDVKSSKSKLSKGKNNKRLRKNENKKIRNRPKQS